ncbi:MAG TPA: O-antigen ligase family protein [Candidatus Levybacteria bacterium]|nr:O-antigen ligase family protein [Candidatus Levybacteria bacterium]
MKRLQISKLIFFLFIIFLPQQFGPHFWPNFSYIQGIRVDYLSLSLYISDVLIILLFAVSIRFVSKKPLFKKCFSNKLLLLLITLCVASLFYARAPYAVLLGMFKFFEFLYLGLFTATVITKKDMVTACILFTCTGVLESVLSIFQFINQQSLNGVFYYFGERYYNMLSIGVATMSLPQGILIRPYGTFPHPNVLAFFLFFTSVFATYGMHNSKNLKRYVFFAAIICIQAGLFLTFSRVVLFLNLLFLLYAFGFVTLRETTKKKLNYVFLAFLLLFTLFYLFLYGMRFNPANFVDSINPRGNLTGLSIKALSSNPLTGVGLLNFYSFEEEEQLNFSAIHLQPVHNIFLLIASELGLLGLFVFGYFLSVVFATAWKKARSESSLFSYDELPLVLLSSLVFAGLFDHYPLTIQQGQLLFAIIVGFSFIKADSKPIGM